MKLHIHGVVQGVGFRPAVVKLAVSMNLSGHVRNNGSSVEVLLSGSRSKTDKFIQILKDELPPLARIDLVEKFEEQPDNDDFIILPSQKGSRSSPIPPDTSICDACLSELLDDADRRHGFPFTNCTNCGARFSIIQDLPYDRPLTTMGDFPLCQSCQGEYNRMGDRRFHAQTISCPDCGPDFTLYDAAGQSVEGGIEGFADLISSGQLGIMKGWGGSHIVCTLKAGTTLRKWYGREEKPFAIMIRDAKAVYRYTKANEEEMALLTSRERPIVLVKKRDRQDLDIISPGLDNIGIMLPYSAVHHLLFKYLDKNIGAVIMTSANPQGEPMAITEPDILGLGASSPGISGIHGIGGYLLHNRKIANRCDDSLIIRHAGHNYFIRRSRGFVPVPLEISQTGNFIGLGAHENLTSATGSAGFIYPSQYIGKSSKYGVLDFLESATRHMMHLRGIWEVNGIGIDMHPGYGNRKLAKRMASEFDCEIMEIQHHWAHAASLLVDAGIDEAVVMTLDGTGYGADGNAWGGEILAATLSSYERVGHLAEFPLLGGEAAVKEPMRLAFAMASLTNRPFHNATREEHDIFVKMIENAPRTTSAGRVLDAVSHTLGVCDSRTYDGEPAMKLERLINSDTNINKDLFNSFNIKDGVIDHITPFGELLDIVSKPTYSGKREKLASAYVSKLVKALCDVAVQAAEDKGIKRIGLTGGVSYNIPITDMIMKELAAQGYELVRHHRVPNGDGGISIGQCAIVGASL